MTEPTASTALITPAFRQLVQQCVHCGLCLQSCPTYAVYGTEMDSPRGRITLMRAAAEGRIGLDGAFAEHVRLCLSCRACEAACPSGVPYGRMVELARSMVERAHRPGTLGRFVRWLALRQILPSTGRLRLIARALRIYQASGLQRLVFRLRLMPERLRRLEALLPPLSARHGDYGRPFAALGERRGTVAFFHGCVQEAFLSDVNAATIRVLQRNGYEVHVPAGQTCCGAAQLHAGEGELSRELARRNVDAFAADRYDAIICNAGGCGAALKEYGHLLDDDVACAERARRFAARIRDVGEFLSEHLNVRPEGALPVRATYVDSCHLRHVQKVARQPRELLRAIPGLELVELAQPDRCCGSAGLYNIEQPETAEAVLDAKLADIAATGAEVVVTANTGCYLHLAHGLRRAGLKARVVHLVELLDESYRTERT